MKRHLLLVTLLLLGWANPMLAATDEDKENIRLGAPIHSQKDSLAVASCSATGTEELDGHRLPAAIGGAGREESIDADGRVPSTNGRVSFWQNAKLGQEYRDYYITMRWRYRLWNWNGTSEKGPESSDFYSKAPRILVTNPRTGKSIIAVVMESGPAPWTGVDRGSNNNPKQGWSNPQDGTPASYKGRVSGFPPVAFQYLGIAQRMSDGSGDDLIYSWASDQSATPGPTNVQASRSAGNCGGSSDFEKKIEFTGTAITPTAIVLHWTGGSMTVDSTISALKSNSGCPGGCSVQLIIDQSGKVFQMTDPLHSLTSHAKGINAESIGIEIAGRGESDLMNNAAQKAAVIKTVAYLVKQYNISLSNDVESKQGILGHYQTDKASYGPKNGKSDPGKNYLEEIRRKVEEAL